MQHRVPPMSRRHWGILEIYVRLDTSVGHFLILAEHFIQFHFLVWDDWFTQVWWWCNKMLGSNVLHNSTRPSTSPSSIFFFTERQEASPAASVNTTWHRFVFQINTTITYKEKLHPHHDEDNVLQSFAKIIVCEVLPVTLIPMMKNEWKLRLTAVISQTAHIYSI